MRKSNDAIVQLSRSLADMKKGRIKKMEFVPFDFKPPEKCYLCKKKTRLCRCIDCEFCGTLRLKKYKECTFCKKKNKVSLVISNAELNALEDLGFFISARLRESWTIASLDFRIEIFCFHKLNLFCYFLDGTRQLVGPTRFELATSCLRGSPFLWQLRRSARLSYRP